MPQKGLPEGPVAQTWMRGRHSLRSSVQSGAGHGRGTRCSRKARQEATLRSRHLPQPREAPLQAPLAEHVAAGRRHGAPQHLSAELAGQACTSPSSHEEGRRSAGESKRESGRVREGHGGRGRGLHGPHAAIKREEGGSR